MKEASEREKRKTIFFIFFFSIALQHAPMQHPTCTHLFLLLCSSIFFVSLCFCFESVLFIPLERRRAAVSFSYSFTLVNRVHGRSKIQRLCRCCCWSSRSAAAVAFSFFLASPLLRKESSPCVPACLSIMREFALSLSLFLALLSSSAVFLFQKPPSAPLTHTDTLSFSSLSLSTLTAMCPVLRHKHSCNSLQLHDSLLLVLTLFPFLFS